MSYEPPAALGLVTGSGTAGYIPQFSGTSALTNSVLSADPSPSTSIAIGAGHLNASFIGANNWMLATLGSSYWNGTNWITPNVGTNQVSTAVIDTSGFAFFGIPSSGATTRTDSSATFLAYEKARIDLNGNLTIAGQFNPGAGVVFATGVLVTQITQALTSGPAHDMVITAQSSTTNSASPAFLYLNAGVNSGGTAKGSVEIGYDGGNGAYATFSPGAFSAQGSITAASVGAGIHRIGNPAPFAMSEDVQWFQFGSIPFNLDITGLFGSFLLSDNQDYTVIYTIQIKAAALHTYAVFAAGWSKASGTLSSNGISTITDPGSLVGAAPSSPTNNIMRLSVTAPSGTVQVTVKAVIIEA